MVNVLDAVNAVIAAKWPDKFVYVNLLPKGFKRPSFFLQQAKATPEPHTKNTLEWTVFLTLDCFVRTDVYNQQSHTDLLALQAEVLTLFVGGSIPADDRFLKVEAVNAGDNPGEAYVDLTITYVDDKAEISPSYDQMQDVRIQYRRDT